MVHRIIGLSLLVLLLATILGCSGGYTPGSMGETYQDGRWQYKDGYSGKWYCEIHANGEWSGTFSGSGGGNSGFRELRGVGDAVVYLPDNAERRTATVQQRSDNGYFSIQIIGPSHTGDLVSGQGKGEITTTQKSERF